MIRFMKQCITVIVLVGSCILAAKEMVPSLPDHVIYRPADLSQLGGEKLGVVAWGNGGCAAARTAVCVRTLSGKWNANGWTRALVEPDPATTMKVRSSQLLFLDSHRPN